MKPASLQTDSSPATQLRKIVLGGSRIAHALLILPVVTALLLAAGGELHAADGSHSPTHQAPATAEVSKVQSQTEHAKRGGFPYPPQMADARVETYKTVGDTQLKLYLFTPAGATNAPAIIFFFGGGWVGGSPQQFADQCRYLASRGMVAITADYRVKSRNQAKPVQCVADARSAVRWVRAHAGQLGIDPNRIAAAGGSAGGHLAACTAFISAFDEPDEDQGVSAAPDALVLFNPGLVLAPVPGLVLKGFGSNATEASLGTQPENISPFHHIAPQAPPSIIFHGRADTTIPFSSSEAFTAAMQKAGNRCELFGYDGQNHGFFNREPYQTRTLMEADKFLTSLGWLKPISPSSDRPR